MSDTDEALKIWKALKPMLDQEIELKTRSCVRAKKMVVKNNPNLPDEEPEPGQQEQSGENEEDVLLSQESETEETHSEEGEDERASYVYLDVYEPYMETPVTLPARTALSNLEPGSPVWVYWYYNNASTMHVVQSGNGSQGTADLDALYSYIDLTASHLRLEFEDALNSLRSYLELTASHLRLEFQDGINSLRSYLEMTASHLRIEFYDDLNSLRSYLELTASHLRLEFYDDINSLRSYLEITASHLRLEFQDDINSLRSYLEITASHLRLEFQDDVNSLRSYLEITASHLRLEFDDAVNSLRSYIEMTSSELRIEFTNEIESLRSYVDIQAGRIDMNVAATDENSSILRQAGMYINDQGVLIYATDNQNNIGSKLNVLSNEISAKVGKSEVVITDDSITIGSQSISLAGYVTIQELEAEIVQLDHVVGSFDVNGSLDVGGTVNAGSIISESQIEAPSISLNGYTLTGMMVNNMNDAVDSLGPATSSGGQITIPYTTLGGTSGSVNFNIADTQYYRDGVAAAETAGENSVAIVKGSWSNGQITFSKSTGTASNKYVYLAAGAASWGSGADANKATVNIYDVYGDVGATTGVVVTVDASSRYSAGRTAGYNEARTEWRPDGITISGKNVTVINAAGDDVGGPYSAAAIYNDGYAAGQASVSQRTAIHVSPRNLTFDSTDKYLSGTCTVFYDDQTFTPGVEIGVNATKAYDAGHSAGIGSVTLNNSDIVRDGSDYYSQTTHKTTIYVEATASNGAQGTQSFTTDDTAYNDGRDSVGVSSWGTATWNASGVTITITLTNGVTLSHFYAE